MWYSNYLKIYDKPLSSVSEEIINDISYKIKEKQSKTPLVTISVIAYNEEKHLLACLWSLSEMQCSYPIEIIGVDNSSTDRTAEIFQRCGIPFYTEERHSCGFARLCGLTKAKGKYHINADADTMYPPKYVEILTKKLEQSNIVAVSSLWSYIPNNKHSKLTLTLYELSRDFYLYLQAIKRPELSVRGLVFGYHTEIARKVGIRTDIIRGEDGSLALSLKKFGKIAFIRNRHARAITGYGTLDIDGSIFNSFKKRLKHSMKHINNLFHSKNNYIDTPENKIK